MLVVAVAVLFEQAVGALVTLVLLPLPGRGIQYTAARVRRGSVCIYPRYTVRLYGYYNYRRLAFAVRFSDFTDCVSAAPPREVYRVFPPEIDISDSV